MRIRKRPLSSLSPVVPPLSSDPLLLSPVVQLHLPPPEEDDTAEYFNAPSSSDHLTHLIQLKKDEEEESSNNDNDNDNTIRSNLLGAKMDTLHDQAFSLKKRIRGNNFDLEEDQLTDKKMKIQKRGTRGSALMEGSRCSRVNGRGWRCCQQTLVGYSLCEHHLGKGRLRSMMSVRSRGSMNVEDDDHKEEIKKQHNNVDYSKVIMDGDHNENDKAALMMSKRKTKKKLGIVKARSMSSLLGQQQAGNNVISLAENNN